VHVPTMRRQAEADVQVEAGLMSNVDKESRCYKIKCVHGDSYGICVGLDSKSKSINVCFMEKKDGSYEPVNGLTIDSGAAHELSCSILKADFITGTLSAMQDGFKVGFERAMKDRIEKLRANPEGIV